MYLFALLWIINKGLRRRRKSESFRSLFCAIGLAGTDCEGHGKPIWISFSYANFQWVFMPPVSFRFVCETETKPHKYAGELPWSRSSELGARSWELVAFALTFMAEKAVHKNRPAHQAHPPTGSLLGSSLRLGLRNNCNKFAISAQTFCWPSAHKHKHAQREKYLFSGKSRVSGNTNFPGTKLNKYYTWVAYRINRAFSSNINILLATRMFLSVYRAQALWCRQTSTERYKNAAANCAAVKDAE